MTTESLAQRQLRLKALRTIRTAAAARDALRTPVRDAPAALSIIATLALVGMWTARPHPEASAFLVVGGSTAAELSADEPAALAPRDAVEFSSLHMLAGLVRVGDGPVIPVPGVTPDELRNSYGNPRDGDRRHAGIDIGAPLGTPLAAALDGWIVSLSNGAAGGLGLHLLDRTGTWLLYYSHLAGYRDDLYPGMAVRQGELLGYVGATGNARGWPHLHFEAARVTSPGTFTARQVNPYDFLLGR